MDHKTQTTRPQTPGRERNGAQPLGSREGLESDEQTRRIGREERRTAGPDGPDAGKAARLTTGKKT